LSILKLVGTGLNPGDITRGAIEEAGQCDSIFWEGYTSIAPGVTFEIIKDLFGPGVVPLDRSQVEDGSVIMEALAGGDVALLVLGDPMVSTTHVTLRVQAAAKNHESRIIHASSILSAAMGESCLIATKFGRMGTISFHRSEQPYDVLSQNLSFGLHTLFLLDIDVEGDRFMTVGDALRTLVVLEGERGAGIIDDGMLIIGLARVSMPDQVIRAGPLRIVSETDFGNPPQSLIVPGDLHFAESEAIDVLLR
jgi:diphthine synthase